jgi:hypothetical protein
MEFLQGKKTYIIVAVSVLAIVAEKFLGIDIPGFEVGEDWLGGLLTMLGLGTLRAGVAKA